MLSPEQQSQFVDDLLAGFAQQRHPDGRGADVVAARVVGAGATDFSLEVDFHALPHGPDLTDRLDGVLAHMRRTNARNATELAGFWSADLDERVLADD